MRVFEGKKHKREESVFSSGLGLQPVASQPGNQGSCSYV
jgi:hypothetical protein